nr:hypothetical protein BAR15_180078 [Bartonella sp. AR 15-3]
MLTKTPSWGKQMIFKEGKNEKVYFTLYNGIVYINCRRL